MESSSACLCDGVCMMPTVQSRMANSRLSSKLSMMRLRSCTKRLASMSGFAMLGCLILIVLLMALIEGFLVGNEIIETPNRAHYYNEKMARKGQNYPICMNLDALEKDLKAEEMNIVNEEKRYEELLSNGQMNCGNIRVGLGLFSKRYLS